MLAGQNKGFANALAFDEGAVGGTEIAHQKISRGVEDNFAMRTGNGAVGQADVIAISAANAMFAVADREGRACGIAANNLEKGHKG